MSVQVDESRCDNQPGSVDLTRTITGVELADLRNTTVLDSDVAIPFLTTVSNLGIR
jgi:hypothetical protein